MMIGAHQPIHEANKGVDFWLDRTLERRKQDCARTTLHNIDALMGTDAIADFKLWRIAMARRGEHVCGDGRDQFIEEMKASQARLLRWTTLSRIWGN